MKHEYHITNDTYVITDISVGIHNPVMDIEDAVELIDTYGVVAYVVAIKTPEVASNYMWCTQDVVEQLTTLGYIEQQGNYYLVK